MPARVKNVVAGDLCGQACTWRCLNGCRCGCSADFLVNLFILYCVAVGGARVISRCHYSSSSCYLTRVSPHNRHATLCYKYNNAAVSLIPFQPHNAVCLLCVRCCRARGVPNKRYYTPGVYTVVTVEQCSKQHCSFIVFSDAKRFICYAYGAAETEGRTRQKVLYPRCIPLQSTVQYVCMVTHIA